MRITSDTDERLVLEHRPVVLPAVAALFGVLVVAQALRSPGSMGMEGWVGTILGASVTACIAYLMALPSRMVFDAVAGEVSWHHRGWPGRDRGRRRLDEITGVEVASGTSTGAQRVTLLTSGGSIPLTRDFWGFARHEQTAATIRDWLAGNGRGIHPG